MIDRISSRIDKIFGEYRVSFTVIGNYEWQYKSFSTLEAAREYIVSCKNAVIVNLH